MTMKAVSYQPLAIDFINCDRRQPIPGVCISFDREVSSRSLKLRFGSRTRSFKGTLRISIAAAPTLPTHERKCALSVVPPEALLAYDRQGESAACEGFSGPGHCGEDASDHADSRNGSEWTAWFLPCS